MELLKKVYNNNWDYEKDNRNVTFQTSRKRWRKFAAYRILFKHIRDSILLIDSEGHILEANAGALKTYGYTREELCTLKIHDLRANKTRNLISSQMREAYDKGIIFETYHVRKNGEQFPVEVSSHQILFKDKKVLLSIIRDISERKRLELEIIESECINTIRNVASGLAHEIRNSITCVHGFLQLAVRQQIDQMKFVEYYDLMLQEINHANCVITELILVANEKGMHKKLLSLNQILMDILPELKAIAKCQNKTVEIQIEETPPIPLDQREINIIVNHLVKNALESTSTGGKVTIRTKMTDNKVILLIKDNDVGIKSEIQEKLRTPSFTTKVIEADLGLIICKSIAIKHNALMSIESSDLGTTFQITFQIRPTTYVEQR